jgi:tetratricopeptide (TPR) repeat protein
LSVKPQWLALGIVAGVLGVLLLSNRQPLSPEGLPVIDTLQGYSDAITEAQALTKDLFDKYDAGEEMTAEDKAKLLDAARIIDNADRYLPAAVIPYLGAGKAYQFAGVLDVAQARYEQCLANVPGHKTDPIAVQTGTEAHFRLSQVQFALGNYKLAVQEADKAVKEEPGAPRYLSGRANALVQLKRVSEAKRDVKQALNLDPNDRVALGLHKLLGD